MPTKTNKQLNFQSGLEEDEHQDSLYLLPTVVISFHYISGLLTLFLSSDRKTQISSLYQTLKLPKTNSLCFTSFPDTDFNTVVYVNSTIVVFTSMDALLVSHSV